MNFENKIALVTGANRGIGKAIVQALLDKNCQKVYAAARDINALPDFVDKRVVPLKLDITDTEQVAEAAQIASDVHVLVNNAGVASVASLLNSDIDLIQHDMNTNYYGTLNMVRAFAPQLANRQASAIVNVVTIAAFSNLPAMGGYSASKAALLSLSQGIRLELRSQGVSVHTVNPGPIDTDMAKGFDGDKMSPEDAANAILASVEAGELDIFPDAISQQMIGVWKDDYHGLEQIMADMSGLNS